MTVKSVVHDGEFFDGGGAAPQTWAGDDREEGKRVGGSWIGFKFNAAVQVSAVKMAQGSADFPGFQGVSKVWLEGSDDGANWERVSELAFDAAVDRDGCYRAPACQPGYTGPDACPCVACQAGKYKDSVGAGACASCPANSDSEVASDDVTDCQCDAGYSGPAGGPCEPTKAPTPTPTKEATHVVKMAVSLPYTVDEFGEGLQKSFKAALAKAAGVAADDVSIDKIEAISAARRRLLEGSIRVDTSIKAKDEQAANSVATLLTADRINEEFGEVGLEAASILENPSVSKFEAEESGLAAGYIALIVAGICAVLLGGGGLFYWQSRRAKPTSIPVVQVSIGVSAVGQLKK